MSDINPNDIAIISAHCRFPGAVGAANFWENLHSGIESITVFSDAELKARGVSTAHLQDPLFVKAAPVLTDIDHFDAHFFGYSPREARLLDPQHRLFLECAWEALELAGYDPEQYPGLIGVYAGMGLSTYLLFNLVNHPDVTEQETVQVMLGNDKDFLSTRTAYHLNLKGPSLDVQTGCSTSLVATHLACDSLLSNQCDMALVGGVTLTMPQRTGYRYQPGGIESPDGHCRPFDAQGQGTVFGSGIGIVVLKRLEDALQDGDTIHAVIKGSAINNDGAAKLGYTAPGVEGQADVVLRAQRVADVDPETIQYVETHGTATELGDPIEIEALTQAFRVNTDRKQFCALGSVKSNIGHLDAAAGIAGLIKTTLSVEHGQIPPTLHFKEPNPRIDFAHSPFFVNDRLRPFTRHNDIPIRAGVSSFGIGGTNAHIILEEAPLTAPSSPSRTQQLLLWSAKTEASLDQSRASLIAYLEQHPEMPLADMAYTLQIGRQRFSWRQALVCTDHADALMALHASNPERLLTQHNEMKTRPVVFMFSGQGSQYAQMGRELYETESVFRKAVDTCTNLLNPLLGFDLRTVLYPTPANEEAAQERLRETAVTQPALFTIEYALAQLWQAWGVQPEAMIGHSIGEFVAACLAGVFTLADALTLVCTRGRLMQAVSDGSMLAVPLSETAVQPYLTPMVSLAAINAPDSCVVSGAHAAIDAVQSQLEADGYLCRRLHTSHAFHSAMMEPAVADFRTAVANVSRQLPQLPYISNVTGTWITAEQATSPDYWADQMRQPVYFANGIGELLHDPQIILLEVGPGKALTTLVRRQIVSTSAQLALSTLRHPQEPESDLTFLLTTVGQLWLAGVPIAWSDFYADESRRRIPLPTYPFARQRYWMDPPQGLTAHSTRKKPDIDDWFYVPSWKRTAPRPLSVPTTAEHWLLFMEGGDTETAVFSASVQTRLHQLGQTVSIVRPGTQFQTLGEGQYTIRSQEQDDYTRLLQQTGPVQTILHLWALTATDEVACFFSLLFLAQALEKVGHIKPLRLGIATSQLSNISGTEYVEPDRALILGASRVIPQEYEGICCQVFDVTNHTSVDYLLADLWTAKEVESASLVAYRGRYRWVQIYEQTDLPTVEGMPALLRPQGIYLITGGLGGLGITVAAYLARTVGAKLALVGRSEVPPRSEWSSVTDEAVQRCIQAVQMLEELGAEVLTLTANVTDEAALSAAVSTAYTHFGDLHGVIHAAGVPGGGMIQLKTMATAQSILAAKVQGAKHLQRCLTNNSLDFLLFFSSVTSILGGLGQSDYSAANAFLDAFAQSEPLSCPVISINWSEWQEVGMAVNTQMPADVQQWRQQELQHGILPAEGAAALARILAYPQPQVIVSTRDFAAMQARSTRLSIANMLSELAQIRTHAHEVRPEGNGRHTNYVAPQTEIEQTIASLWQKALDLDQIGIHDNFFELGGNSLIGLQLVNRINEALDLQISAVSLYESPTVYKLIQMITSDGQEENMAEERQGRGARRRERLQRKRK